MVNRQKCSILFVRKKLSCNKIGIDCSYMVTATTEKLLMQTALKHISEFHIKKPQEISPELKAKMKASIEFELDPLSFR
jgi:predicted small metal-binding protein